MVLTAAYLSLLVIISALFMMPVLYATACVFDTMKPSTIPQTTLLYTNGWDSHNHNGSNRDRRNANERLVFEPIRIKPFFYDLELELSVDGSARLSRLLKEALGTVSNLFSVIRVKETLRLSRSPTACREVWQNGINANKCAEIKSNYKGEFCLAEFQIPDDHLEGLYVWNSTSPHPVREVFPRGAGVPDADMILYVKSITASTCINSGYNVIAYATYCQLDQNSRPIAGYINICPQMVQDKSVTDRKLSLTILHELFHALGFSSDLFKQFKQCSVSGATLSCADVPYSVRTVLGSSRLVTPKVVAETSRHFGCVTHSAVNEFGPMLQTQNNAVYSHWDGAFMHGSLMAPSIGLPHLTVLDNITLSLFEDTGWYQVNYQMAESYTWGQGRGCQFATDDYCRSTDNEEFCQGSASGCHYRRLDRGTCESAPLLRQCKVYRAAENSSCQLSSTISIGSNPQLLGNTSRCFLSNLTSQVSNSSLSLTGMCFEHRCDNNKLFVRISGRTEWQRCPSNSAIQVNGFSGVILCPSVDLLCSGDFISTTQALASVTLSSSSLSQQSTTTTVSSYVHTMLASTSRVMAAMTLSSSLTSTGAILTDKMDVFKIELFFNVTFSQVDKSFLDGLLKDIIESKLTELCWFGSQRISQFKINSLSNTVNFDLYPSTSPADGLPTKDVVSCLKQLIDSSNLTIQLDETITLTVKDMRVTPGGPAYAKSSLNSVRLTLIIVGMVMVAIFIGVLMFCIQRYYTIRHRAGRAAANATRRDVDQHRINNVFPSNILAGAER